MRLFSLEIKAEYYFKMPTEMSSWADEIDETDTSLILPPPSEKWVGNQKITTEYSHNDDGKKVRLIDVDPSPGFIN